MSSSGTPQGSPISPLLANIALHQLDEVWSSKRPAAGSSGQSMPTTLSSSAGPAKGPKKAQRRAKAVLGPLGLQLNPDKTRIAELTRGKEGFDFLGFHLHKVESWKLKGRWYLQRWPSVRAMANIRAKVRAGTLRRFVGADMTTVVEHLNPVLRGWGNYCVSRGRARLNRKEWVLMT